MFVCILFCGFNGTNGTEALVCARAVVTDNSSNEHSAWFQKQHISASDHLLFNTNEQNEYSVTQLEMFHLLHVCIPKCLKKTLLLNYVGVAFRGISDLSAYTAGANARIRFISDLFPHMNEAWNRSENIGIHAIFSCLHSRGPYPICATWEEKKTELGHLNHAV